MQQESFVGKIIYRLIRKHIAGNTMGSALQKAKSINMKGVPVSITFLSDILDSRVKASYITTTYMQLIREVSRLGIKGSAHVLLEQLGSRISKEVAIENAKKVIEFGNKYGVFIWLESNDENNLLTQFSSLKGVGAAFSSIEGADAYYRAYARRHKYSMIKVMCTSERKSKPAEEISVISRLANSSKVVLLSPNDNIIEKFLKNGNKYKKSLIFEFPLGYSEKRLGKWIKKGAYTSMYIPFGKDWVRYTMSNVPDGYMKALAASLLSEKVDKEKEIKNEKRKKSA